MRQEVVGIQFDGLVVVGHGTSQIVDVIACQRTIHIIIGHGGLQMNGFSKLLVCIFPLFTAQTDHRPHRPGLSIIGIEFQRAVEKGRGLHGISLLHAHFCLELIDFCVGFPSVHHRIEFEIRLVKVLVLYATQRTIIPQVHVHGVIGYGLVIIGGGIAIFLLSDTAHSAKFIDSGHVGIQADCFRTIVLRTEIIIEIVFRQGPEIPWFIEIRLGGDYLVEILDGQNVVFIIERTAPGHDDSVNVILGTRGQKGKKTEKQKTLQSLTFQLS